MKKTFLDDTVSSSETFTLNELFTETIVIHDHKVKHSNKYFVNMSVDTVHVPKNSVVWVSSPHDFVQ